MTLSRARSRIHQDVANSQVCGRGKAEQWVKKGLEKTRNLQKIQKFQRYEAETPDCCLLNTDRKGGIQQM